MNTQFKKGVLELIVLFSIKDCDKYGYQLVSDIGETFRVNEGTIYPILKRLTLENYLKTYLRESNEGPSRKYYSVTTSGLEYLKKLNSDWKEFSEIVNKFLLEGDRND